MLARAPVSHAQERYFRNVVDGRSNFNCMLGWRLQGQLDEPALLRALDTVAARHEALRTTLGEQDGSVWQTVAPAAAVAVERHALAAGDEQLAAALGALADRPVTLDGGPLVRAHLLRSGARDHTLALVMHHAVADGWSCVRLHEELTALYAAPLAPQPVELPAAERQLRHHAAAARAPLPDATAAWWRARLDPARTPLRLAVAGWGERPRRLVVDVAATVGAGTMAAVGRQARTRRTTVMACVLAAVARALAPFAGEDVSVAVVHANRPTPASRLVVGLLADFLPVRVATPAGGSLAASVDAATDAWLGALEQAAPLGALWELLDRPCAWPEGALCDVTLNFQPHLPQRQAPAEAALLAAGATLSRPAAPTPARRIVLAGWPTGSFPLELNVVQRPDGAADVRVWRPEGLLEDTACRAIGAAFAAQLDQLGQLAAAPHGAGASSPDRSSASSAVGR